jgi:ectoine hydroxylase-related dioxygenase (phytanoyl-CoA dioxygenase family)
MRLTEQQVQAYQTQGFLSGLTLVAPEEAERVRALFDALEAQEGRDKTRIGLLDRHFDQPFIRDLALRPTLLDCIEQLIGPDFLLLATHFFCKYGQEEKFVAWHQDATYWGLEPPQAITAWYAVDDSDRENGCMRVLPGTHRDGIREHGKSGNKENLLSVDQEVPVTAAEAASAVDLELRAGQISLHDGALIHGSLPNRSQRRRCGLTIRFVPASVKPTGTDVRGRAWKPTLVRGADREGYWRPLLVSRP